MAQKVLAQQGVVVAAAGVAGAHPQARHRQRPHGDRVGGNHPAFAQAVGGLEGDGVAALQAGLAGQGVRHTDQAGARVHQKHHRHAVDAARHTKVAVVVAGDHYRAFGRDGGALGLKGVLHGKVQHGHHHQPEREDAQGAHPHEAARGLAGIGGRAVVAVWSAHGKRDGVKRCSGGLPAQHRRSAKTPRPVTIWAHAPRACSPLAQEAGAPPWPCRNRASNSSAGKGLLSR